MTLKTDYVIIIVEDIIDNREVDKMKRYKGYYIDGVVFNNEAEIDKYLEEKIMELFINACKMFISNPCMETSIHCSKLSMELANKYGYTMDELEDVEMEVLISIER